MLRLVPATANLNMSQALRLTLPDFNGSISDTKAWYRKFSLLATKYWWDNVVKCLHMSFYLADLAGVWFSSLSEDDAKDWTKLKAALEKHFLNTEPTLVTESKLQLPSGRGQYSLYTDGSRTGLGATLIETVDGKSHVVGYASRTVTSAEHKSSVTELELSAIEFALTTFRYLLYTPKPFNIYTDHHAIMHIMTSKSPTATKKIASQVSFMSQYNFHLFHVKGEQNALADMLSRDLDFTNHSNSFPEISNMVADNAETQNPPLWRSPRLAEKAARRQQELANNSVKQQAPTEPLTRRSQHVKHTSSEADGMASQAARPAMLGTGLSSTNHEATPISQPTRPQLIPPQLPLIKPSIEVPVKNRRSDMVVPVDTLYQRSVGDNKMIYLPEHKSLFDNKNIKVKFSDRFHGSVPQRTRNQIRGLALKDYKIGINKDDLCREQRLDPNFRNLITYLEHRILPANKEYAKRILNMEEHYCMIGDILFSFPNCNDPYDETKQRLQLVIPDALANSIISAKHDQFLGTGHAGFLRCLNTIRRKYFIHDLDNKLKNYIGTCGLCLKLRKSKKPNTNIPLQPAAGKSCIGPFQRLQNDHAGPFYSQKYSSRHILVVTDEFSQYSWLFATDTTGAEDTFACLNKLIRIYGIPSLGISSDRRPSFISEVMACVSRVYGIQWTHDLTTTPSSTGLFENRVKLLKQLLSFIILRSPDVDLYDTLLDLQYSLNCTASSVTGLSPHFAFHGYDPVDPTDHSLQV